jgi:PAS domain S-box-containing protein
MIGSPDVRVLHVDDELESADLAADRLEGADERLAIETATGVDDGLARLADSNVDCVVSEHRMPEQDGIRFLKTVRETHPGVPFVLFIAEGSEAVTTEAISAGVTDYLRKNPDGTRYELLATRIRDAVERHRFRTSYREIFEGIPDGVVIHDPDDGAFVDMNETYADLFGYDRDELLEAGFEAIHPGTPPYTVANARRRIREAIDHGSRTFEWPGVRNDGDQFWTEVHLTPVRLRGQDRLLAVVRDVTERKNRERELREKGNLLDQLFAQVPTHLYIKDTDGRLRRVSEHFVDDPERQLGRTDRDIFSGEFGEEAYADDMRVIETGEPILQKEEALPEEGEWHLTSKVPWYDEDDEIAGLIGVTWDITERKEYEAELKRQNDRLEEFASIVSHDLRNPLNVAEGRLELSREECNSEHLDSVAKAHDRMKALIENLLALARESEAVTDPETIDLAGVVESCWRNVDTPGATIHGETDRTIRADRSRLAQLLENLFRNAVEHGSTSNRTPPDDAVEHGSTNSRFSSGSAVEHGEGVTVTVGDLDDGFYVADDGPGIPPEDRERIFESGYSTLDDGTGFGLAIVREIADAHDWDIRVTESETGGARFEVTGVGLPE